MTYRNADLLSLARYAPRCMACGRHNDGTVVAAHSNFVGKGLGLKATDYAWAAMDSECHAAYDQGKDMSREDRRAFWMRAYWATQEWLWTSGHVSAHLTPQPQPVAPPPIKVKIRSGRKLQSGAKIQNRGFEKPDTPQKITNRPWTKRAT